MALIVCPECGRDRVSSTAVACPECGFNIKTYFESISNQEQVEVKTQELPKPELDKQEFVQKTEVVPEENIVEITSVEEDSNTGNEIDVEQLGYSRYQIIWDTMVSSIFIALGCSILGGFMLATLASPEYFLISVVEGYILCVPFFIMIISNVLLSKKGIKAYSLAGKLFYVVRKTAKKLITINIVKFMIALFLLIWEVVIFVIFLFFSAPITVLYYAVMYLVEKKVEFEDAVAAAIDKVIPVLGCVVTTIYFFTNSFFK